MTLHPSTTGASAADEAAKDVIAALTDLPLLGHSAVAALLAADADRYFVDTLPDRWFGGVGVGEAALYRIPVNIHGDPATRHRTTWAVLVDYPFGGENLAIAATEEVARANYASESPDG